MSIGKNKDSKKKYRKEGTKKINDQTEEQMNE